MKKLLVALALLASTIVYGQEKEAGPGWNIKHQKADALLETPEWWTSIFIEWVDNHFLAFNFFSTTDAIFLSRFNLMLGGNFGSANEKTPVLVGYYNNGELVKKDTLVFLPVPDSLQVDDHAECMRYYQEGGDIQKYLKDKGDVRFVTYLDNGETFDLTVKHNKDLHIYKMPK